MRKIVAVALLMFIFISSFYSIYATEEELTNLKFVKHCGELFRTAEKIPDYSFVTYESNGKEYPVYCLNNELAGVTEGHEYPVRITGKIENELAWKVIINGYPYKTPEELGVANEIEAFVATKNAVNIVLNDYPDDRYIALDSDASRRVMNAYHAILNTARNSTEKMETNITCKIVSESSDWKVDENDPTCVSKNYKLDSNIKSGKYSIKITLSDIEGLKLVGTDNTEKSEFDLSDSFKVMVPIKELSKPKSFSMEADISLKSMPILYGATTVNGMQNYALTGEKNENVIATLDDHTIENITKLTIIKKELNSEETIQGVKFNLLNENREVIKESLITNENGEIILKNMMPGKYYLNETETLDKYNLYTDLIEINLDFNEDLKIIVNNSLKEVIEINQKKENLEINPSSLNIVKNQKIETNTINDEKVGNVVKKLPVTGY